MVVELRTQTAFSFFFLAQFCLSIVKTENVQWFPNVILFLAIEISLVVAAIVRLIQ